MGARVASSLDPIITTMPALATEVPSALFAAPSDGAATDQSAGPDMSTTLIMSGVLTVPLPSDVSPPSEVSPTGSISVEDTAASSSPSSPSTSLSFTGYAAAPTPTWPRADNEESLVCTSSDNQITGECCEKCMGELAAVGASAMCRLNASMTIQAWGQCVQASDFHTAKDNVPFECVRHVREANSTSTHSGGSGASGSGSGARRTRTSVGWGGALVLVLMAAAVAAV